MEQTKEDEVRIMIQEIKYNGTVKDKRINPVFALLLEYKKMRRNEIISHIHSWWFDVDGNEMFKQARDSGLIVQTEDKHWSLLSDNY